MLTLRSFASTVVKQPNTRLYPLLQDLTSSTILPETLLNRSVWNMSDWDEDTTRPSRDKSARASANFFD